jgi:hypothetical protein
MITEKTKAVLVSMERLRVDMLALENEIKLTNDDAALVARINMIQMRRGMDIMDRAFTSFIKEVMP